MGKRNIEQGNSKQENLNRLLQKSQVKERPFISNTPFIGKLITHFREAWNNVSTKWYVRSILQQQNEFNRLIVEHFYEYDDKFTNYDYRLIAQDREQTDLVHDVAELTAQVIKMNQLLQSIDQRLRDLKPTSRKA